jgi:hypothetical protein
MSKPSGKGALKGENRSSRETNHVGRIDGRGLQLAGGCADGNREKKNSKNTL